MQSRCAAVGSPTRRAHRGYLAEASNGRSLPGPARRPRRAQRATYEAAVAALTDPTHTAVVLVARAADELAALPARLAESRPACLTVEC